MPRFTFRLALTALLLTAALAVPCAAAAAPTAQQHRPACPGLLHQLWTALTASWGSGVTPDDGCRMDPDGRCLPGSAVPAPAITTDSGCRWDPNGGCLPG